MRGSAETRDIPVIMLTAKSAEYDKVIGLEAGADDYMTKPFGVMELVSRVRAVLRRSGRSKADGSLLTRGAVSMDTARYSVSVGEREVPLTVKEFELLKLLMENMGQVLSRDQLLERVWGYNFDGETRTVDVHVRSLRKKLDSGGEIIETVRGVGYRVG
jgi:two-component system alkaline phosphatase synthesis response regulator PhoP